MPNPTHFISKQNYFETYENPEEILANFVCERVN